MLVSVKFIVAHRKDPNNVGDIASNPLQYFLPPDEYQTIDVAKLDQEVYPTGVPIILGGGGLLCNSFIGDPAEDLLHSPDRDKLRHIYDNTWELSNPGLAGLHQNFVSQFQNLVQQTISQIPTNIVPRYVWGAGHNGDLVGSTEDLPRYPKAFSEYSAIGIRDYNEKSRYDWVPCASAMHPALLKDYPIKNDIIWFEHKKQMLKDFGNDSIPRFVNSGSNIDHTIELLGSANIILTNSYHGAYWGTLLKKRVVVVGPWSSKFQFMKHQPVMPSKRESWQDALERAVIYPNALAECRNANENFWNRIK
jgi:hypothetical protein